MRSISLQYFAVALGLLMTGGSCAIVATAQENAIPPVVTVQPTTDGFTATVGGETLRMIVCRDAVVHLIAAPGDTAPLGASPQQPWMLDASSACPGAKFEFSQGPDTAWLTTAKLRVTIEKQGGNLVYSTLENHELLRETSTVPRTYQPVKLDGNKPYRVMDRFATDNTEGFYGLGQHQNGMFNYTGSTVELGQQNTDIAIPLLVSSKGYGLLWNTASLSFFDNRFAPALSISSIAANAVDYYFLYGPEMDGVIHEYRQLTGHAPMFPQWAFGFMQSKDVYHSQAELLDIARRYRTEHLPMDVLVQDADWWKKQGDLEFNKNYPDVPATLKELGDEHVHTMISVWGLFDGDSANLRTLRRKHWEIPGTHVYDPTNPAAVDFFWSILPGPLLRQGWESFWLDSSEPEESYPHGGDAILQDKTLAIGSGAMYTNIFPFMHTGGIAQHWRKAAPDKRVLLLTRSAFLGQQRHGTIVWSGDLYPTHLQFQRQIPAGLNFALSGMPYWTTDIAGYWPLYEGASMMTPADQELYARWFQFGAFCPIFRTHGRRNQNEIWAYSKVEPILIQYDKLRYRMLPYLYSLAWKVTSEDYTIQRPLLMDWRTDPKVLNVADEYMFGPAFLVSPVWKEGATRRDVYLPAAAAWYDFWTGKRLAGGQDLTVAAPLETLPLFVRAGSIVPLGPEIEYTGQKPSDPMDLRVYRGADGSFSLYEDEGDTYGYEKGRYAVIPMHWNDASSTLTLGKRSGTFPGMIAQRKFRVVVVAAGHGIGEEISSHADAEVEYRGEDLDIRLPKQTD
ncbi:MAG TPA: TIM-barrel domain-containing protein [Acidobacteriaceae bacterium]|nr:TIM-barrel domain-containing protein [Acidobacteriaceae bacterium]